MTLVDHVYGIDGSFWLFKHVPWDGFTFASLILPAFLFIMGIAIPLSIKHSNPIKLNNVKRIIKLFCLGVIINLFFLRLNCAAVRPMGILQRLSICYGIVLFVHWLSDYGTNILRRNILGIMMFALVPLHTYLMLTWEDPAKGCHKPNLTRNCNFSGYIDEMVFSRAHMQYPTDPEGLVPTMTSCFTTYCGYIFGIILVKYKK